MDERIEGFLRDVLAGVLESSSVLFSRPNRLTSA